MFDEAIGEALKLVREEDTMIVATADHSHTFSLGGNSMRGNPVYGREKIKFFLNKEIKSTIYNIIRNCIDEIYKYKRRQSNVYVYFIRQWTRWFKTNSQL